VEQNDLSLSRPSTLHYSSEIHPYVSEFDYLCPVAQSVKLYPLFGLTMSNWMFDMHDLDVDWDGDHVHVDDGGNHNEFRIGVNLGAGAEFALGRNWAMNVEFRYQLVDDFDQGVINFGAAYRF
jgi:outer membrane protein X